MGQKIFSVILLLIFAPLTVLFLKEAISNSDEEMYLYAFLSGLVAIGSIAALIFS